MCDSQSVSHTHFEAGKTIYNLSTNVFRQHVAFRYSLIGLQALHDSKCRNTQVCNREFIITLFVDQNPFAYLNIF